MNSAKDRKSNRSDREPVAFHEAGHIVAAFARDVRVVSATIIQTQDRNGHVQPAGRMVPKGDLLRTFLETEIIILLAGPAAERMVVERDIGVRTDDLQVEEFVKVLNPDPEVADATSAI
jgi:hypothetical protein